MGVESPAKHAVFAFERYDPTDKSIAWLREQGLEVRTGHALWEMPFQRFTEDELIAHAEGCIALMGASGTRITRRVFDSLPDLRYISKYGIGFDSIDMEAAGEHGVLVSNTPNENQIFPVSEFAIAMMLWLAKQFGVWTPDFMRAGGWRGLTYSAVLSGATVGVVGLGRIGRGVAQRLSGWEARIIGYDPHVTEPPPGVELASFDELVAEFGLRHIARGACAGQPSHVQPGRILADEAERLPDQRRARLARRLSRVADGARRETDRGRSPRRLRPGAAGSERSAV